MRNLLASFNEQISLCIKVDERLRARQSQQNYNSHEAAGVSGTGAMADACPSRIHEGRDGEEPMQLSGSHLTAAEHQCRILASECL